MALLLWDKSRFDEGFEQGKCRVDFGECNSELKSPLGFSGRKMCDKFDRFPNGFISKLGNLRSLLANLRAESMGRACLLYTSDAADD